MTNNKYLPTIGLEIHAELKTASKMFCSCRNDPDEEKPNVNICSICLGHPGTLPVLNHEAIKHVLEVGVAIDGKLADFTEWDRKNYFYPDIPKGYQISQYKFPLVSDGELAGVKIERVHLEEDTAQSTHDTHEKSLVNFNRSGVPLLELVTKPVIHDAETAVHFAKELRLLLRYLGAGEANMEKGEMRVEANVSVAKIKQGVDVEHIRTRLGREVSPDSPCGFEGESYSPQKGASQTLGTKTEIKNLNSFKSVEKAIAYEIKRQTSLLESGQSVVQETRGWNDTKNETYSQRSKESSHDYRYYPDPDIPKLKLSEMPEFSRETLKKELPELPWIKRERFIKKFGMTDKEAAVFVDMPEIANYFESVITSYANDTKKIKLTINYILSDYIGMLNNSLNSDDIASSISTISAKYFAEMVDLIATGNISSRGAKNLLALMLIDSKSQPKTLAEKHGLIQKSDTADLDPVIMKVIVDNTSVVAEYKTGKTASLQFLIGQVMKTTKGSANPTVVQKLLIEKLS